MEAVIQRPVWGWPWGRRGLFLVARQRSLQYSTLSQFLAQLLRQVMARPQTAQGFWGKSCLFPLKPEGERMVFSKTSGGGDNLHKRV